MTWGKEEVEEEDHGWASMMNHVDSRTQSIQVATETVIWSSVWRVITGLQLLLLALFNEVADLRPILTRLGGAVAVVVSKERFVFV